MVRPDETRKAERACVNTTSDQTCWTSVSRSYKTEVFPHTCITDSFEGRSVEGLHVNSPLFSVSVCGNERVSSVRCGQQVDGWYVFDNHAERRMCLFLVPRLTPVERPSSLLRSVLFRAFALFARFCAQVVRCPSFGCE